MKRVLYYGKRIPKDWIPWIKISRDLNQMFEILDQDSTHNQRQLVAALLSAAKWLTGNPSDWGIDEHEVCGLCLYENEACDHCLESLNIPPNKTSIEPRCCSWARKGGAMKLYANLLRQYNATQRRQKNAN